MGDPTAMQTFLDWLSQPATTDRLRELATAGVRSITAPGGSGITLEPPPPVRVETPATAEDPNTAERRALAAADAAELKALTEVMGGPVPYFERIPPK
jgi:hypothetical protein